MFSIRVLLPERNIARRFTQMRCVFDRGSDKEKICYAIENPVTVTPTHIKHRGQKGSKSWLSIPENYPAHIKISEEYAEPIVRVIEKGE
jgi:hypothetical protein